MSQVQGKWIRLHALSSLLLPLATACPLSTDGQIPDAAHIAEQPTVQDGGAAASLRIRSLVQGLGTGNKYTSGLAPDPSGGFYVTGSYWGDTTASISDGESEILLGDAIGNGGEGLANADHFVAKYANDNRLLWARTIVGDRGEFSGFCTVLDDGGVVVVGIAERLGYPRTDEPAFITFSPGSSDAVSYEQTGVGLFAARYSSAGQLLWARLFDGGSYPRIARVISPNGEEVVLAGWFVERLTMVADEPVELLAVEEGGHHGFVLRLDSAGVPVEALSLPFAPVYALAGDSQSLYLGGKFTGTTTFGREEPTEVTFTASGAGDAFVSRFSWSLSHGWTKTWGNEGDEAVISMDVLGDGAVVMAGLLAGPDGSTVVFKEGDQEISLESGPDHLFVGALSADGDPRWVKGATGERPVLLDVAVTEATDVVFVTRDPGLYARVYSANGALKWSVPLTSDARLGSAVSSPAGGTLVSGYFNGEAGPLIVNGSSGTEHVLESPFKIDFFVLGIGFD